MHLMEARARVAELVDAPDLGSGVERRGGSSPPPGTIFVLPCMFGLEKSGLEKARSTSSQGSGVALHKGQKNQNRAFNYIGNPFLLSVDRFT